MRRRGFFRALLSEGMALAEEAGGTPQLRLTDLSRVPDEVLADLHPALLPDVQLVTDGGRMRARRDGGDPIDLYAAHELGARVLARFDGSSSIGAIADDLAAAIGGRAQALVQVKTVFLRVVGHGICAPSDPLPESARAGLVDDF